MGNHKGQSYCHSHGGRTPTGATASVTLNKPVLQFRSVPQHDHHPSTGPAPCQTELWQHPLRKAASFLPWPKRETFLFCSVDKCAEERQLSGYVQSPISWCLSEKTLVGCGWALPLVPSSSQPKHFGSWLFMALIFARSQIWVLHCLVFFLNKCISAGKLPTHRLQLLLYLLSTYV